MIRFSNCGGLSRIMAYALKRPLTPIRQGQSSVMGKRISIDKHAHAHILVNVFVPKLSGSIILILADLRISPKSETGRLTPMPRFQRLGFFVIVPAGNFCLSACLPACLPANLPTYLPTCLSVCRSVCLSVCCLSVCLSKFWSEVKRIAECSKGSILQYY